MAFTHARYKWVDDGDGESAAAAATTTTTTTSTTSTTTTNTTNTTNTNNNNNTSITTIRYTRVDDGDGESAAIHIMRYYRHEHGDILDENMA